jgi:hypothetical protein
MVEQGTKITEVSNKLLNELKGSFYQKSSSLKAKEADSQNQLNIQEDELRTRSESKGKFKPGPKSQN